MSSDGLAKPDNQGHEKVKMEDTQRSNAVSSGVFADAMPTADIASESSVSSSLASTESVALKSSSHKIPAKFVGHSGNRIQPVRYAGQYNHLHAGPAFMHPNSQNVMVGRIGPVVSLHPLARGSHHSRLAGLFDESLN